jgi:hypothetical protein
LNLATSAYALDADAAKFYSPTTIEEHEALTAKIIRTADGYEAIVAQGNAPVEVYINLAVLYWQCTEPGFLVSTNFNLTFFKRAGERYPEVLNEAARKYAQHSEVQFWQLYCDYITLGNPPFEEQCIALTKHPDCPLVPYFYLFSARQGQAYQEEATRLLDCCRASLSLKSCYIISVIAGVQMRLQFSRLASS